MASTVSVSVEQAVEIQLLGSQTKMMNLETGRKDKAVVGPGSSLSIEIVANAHDK